MKWTHSIKNRLGASVVLLALCLLVLLSNYLDRLHTQNVKSSISTMYEDRLIVEVYILRMTQNVYQIREILKAGENNPNGTNVDSLARDFKNTFNIYSKTRLTKIEKATAVKLIRDFRDFEQTLSKGNVEPAIHTDRILNSLNRLSTIQLDESKLIMKQVEAQYATIKASSQFAFAIVIVILIVLQVMVFSGESLIPVFKPKDPTLN